MLYVVNAKMFLYRILKKIAKSFKSRKSRFYMFKRMFKKILFNRRSELERTCASFHIIHIIFCLFITPIYLGFISYFMCFILNKNKEKKVAYLNIFKVLFFLLFSLLRGLLMFPYIILFFPFIVILLLRGIFSYKYYLYIYYEYVTALFPGPYPLDNI